MKLCRSERSTKIISPNDSTRQIYLIVATTTFDHLKRSRSVVYLWRYCWSCQVPFVGGKFCRGGALSIHSHQQSASSAEFRCNHDSELLLLFLQMYLAYHLLLFSFKILFSLPVRTDGVVMVSSLARQLNTIHPVCRYLYSEQLEET
jgi:hypothetical protein